MAIAESIKGRYVDLRSCTEEDAAFTREIRRDPEFIKYLPKIDNTIEQQVNWIQNQRNKVGDYFFVVWNKNKERIGTVSVFDIQGDNPKTGRLALKGNALENIEAQFLSFNYAFNTLGTEKLWGFIYSENHRAIRFAEIFGSTLMAPSIDLNGRSIREVFFSKYSFNRKVPQIQKMIYR